MSLAEGSRGGQVSQDVRSEGDTGHDDITQIRPARPGQYIATLYTGLLNRKLSNECPVMAFHFSIKESSISPSCIYSLSLFILMSIDKENEHKVIKCCSIQIYLILEIF